MGSLEEFSKGLPEDKQFSLALKLLKKAIPLWDEFINEKNLSYKDGLVGLKHNVSGDLALKSAKLTEKFLESGVKDIKEEILSVRLEFTDPVVALQDDDWNLPETVLLTFYSAYNLINAISEKNSKTFGPSSVSVSINQSIDALEKSKTLTPEQIKDILNHAG